MKRSTVLASALLLTLALPAITEAQSRQRRTRDNQAVSNTEGFLLGGGLEITTHDPRRGRSLGGGGAGLTFGYGFGQNIALLANVSGAALDDDYTLTHADALLRATFRDSESKVRPFITGGVSRRVLSRNKYDGFDGDIFDDLFDGDSTTRESNGTGVTLGVGLSIFVIRELAIDISLLGTGGDYREHLIDGEVVARDRRRAGSGRLRVGVMWSPGK